MHHCLKNTTHYRFFYSNKKNIHKDNIVGSLPFFYHNFTKLKFISASAVLLSGFKSFLQREKKHLGCSSLFSQTKRAKYEPGEAVLVEIHFFKYNYLMIHICARLIFWFLSRELHTETRLFSGFLFSHHIACVIMMVKRGKKFFF